MDAAATRYAKTIFNLFSSNEERTLFLHDLKTFSIALQNNQQIVQFFLSPKISSEQKKQVLKKSQCCPEKLQQFLVLLIDKNRFADFFNIIDAFEIMLNADLNIIKGEIITPFPIDDENAKALENQLTKEMQKKVTLTKKVNPSLIGGGILTLENKMIDFSVKGKLDRLKTYLAT